MPMMCKFNTSCVELQSSTHTVADYINLII